MIYTDTKRARINRLNTHVVHVYKNFNQVPSNDVETGKILTIPILTNCYNTGGKEVLKTLKMFFLRSKKTTCSFTPVIFLKSALNDE